MATVWHFAHSMMIGTSIISISDFGYFYSLEASFWSDFMYSWWITVVLKIGVMRVGPMGQL